MVFIFVYDLSFEVSLSLYMIFEVFWSLYMIF